MEENDEPIIDDQIVKYFWEKSLILSKSKITITFKVIICYNIVLAK